MKGSLAAMLRTLTLPFGATSGKRIVIDGVQGQIIGYDDNGNIVIVISPDSIQNAGAVAGINIHPDGLSVISTQGARSSLVQDSTGAYVHLQPANTGGIAEQIIGSNIMCLLDVGPDYRPYLWITVPQISRNGTTVGDVRVYGPGEQTSTSDIKITGLNSITTDGNVTAKSLTVSGGGGGVDIGDWTAWVPVLYGTTTNPVLSNGNIHAQYRYTDKHNVQSRNYYAFGAGSTKGSGNVQASIPVGTTHDGNYGTIGQFYFFDSGVKTFTGYVVRSNNSANRLDFIRADTGANLQWSDLTGTFTSSYVRVHYDYPV